MNEGTIYPLLKRLTNEHYFETYLRESSEGPPRKYYHLTAGRGLIPGRPGGGVGRVSAAGEPISKGAEAMRNKDWFLKELQGRIAVLEDAEQRIFWRNTPNTSTCGWLEG